jgi:hypothetical protein
MGGISLTHLGQEKTASSWEGAAAKACHTPVLGARRQPLRRDAIRSEKAAPWEGTGRILARTPPLSLIQQIA